MQCIDRLARSNMSNIVENSVSNSLDRQYQPNIRKPTHSLMHIKQIGALTFHILLGE